MYVPAVRFKNRASPLDVDHTDCAFAVTFTLLTGVVYVGDVGFPTPHPLKTHTLILFPLSAGCSESLENSETSSFVIYPPVL